MSLPTHDLSNNRAESPDKAFQSFMLHRPGKIIFVGHHLSTKNHVRCIIKKISQYGAELEVIPGLDVPKNFFLEILGIHDEIGCTLMRRQEEIVTVGFNMLIDPEFLHHVLRLDFESR